jgi:hypothetical protein
MTRYASRTKTSINMRASLRGLVAGLLYDYLTCSGSLAPNVETHIV